MKTTMQLVTLSGFIIAIVLPGGTGMAGAIAHEAITDQMICRAGDIQTVLNRNYSRKSFTCLVRSNRSSKDYNNLAEIYADGWYVDDINDRDVWIFYKSAAGND